MDSYKDCQMKFRLTADMKEKIERLANKKDVSCSWLIREAIKNYIKEDK
jgi:predicted transcriptional regulator